jgi:hypothetical protein
MIGGQNNLITVLELRQLLHQLKDLRPDIGIRFRLMGEMWQPHHLGVMKVSEKGVMLNHKSVKALVIVTDLNNVMQFDIDHPFQQFRPHFHYNVSPVLVT